MTIIQTITMDSRKLSLSTSMVVVVFVLLLGFSGQDSLNSVGGDPLEGGENVCTTSYPIKKDIKVVIPVNYEFKVQSMCGVLPCMKTRTETRLDESIKTIIKNVEKQTCCAGYTETPERKCAPICLNSCNNGKCVGPNLCKCQPEPTDTAPGFVGPTCSRFSCLNSTKWGSKCDKECNCTSMNSYCSANTGNCLCHPGWRGENCTQECDSSSSHDPQCDGYSELPPIIGEPGVNIDGSRSSNYILPDALVIEEDKINGSDNRINFWIASTLFSIVCWASLIVYIIVVRRNNKQPNEDPYYESCSGSGPSDHGYYYTPSSSSTTATTRSMPRGENFLGKNLSMTAVIRNALQGVDLEKNGNADCNRSRPILAPKIETHLINSQLRSQKNVYSEPSPSFERLDCRLYATPTTKPSSTLDAEHIYQVPKSPSHRSPATTLSNLDDALGRQLNQNDSSMETISEQHDNFDEHDNIYEELKPRNPGPC